MSKFKILGTFEITGRGYVLMGDITDEGSVSVGDILLMQDSDGKEISVKIIGVNRVDCSGNKMAHTGLLIPFNEMDKMNRTDLKGAECMVLECEPKKSSNEIPWWKFW